MSFRTVLLALACTVGLAGAAHAQKKGDDGVPKEYRPPPGMCRIWLDKVPARQQPAPTDCPTAVRNRPPNGKVLFGDDYVDGPDRGDRKSLPLIRKFGDDRKSDRKADRKADRVPVPVRVPDPRRERKKKP